jgi:hypothetical protein
MSVYKINYLEENCGEQTVALYRGLAVHPVACRVREYWCPCMKIADLKILVLKRIT